VVYCIRPVENLVSAEFGSHGVLESPVKLPVFFSGVCNSTSKIHSTLNSQSLIVIADVLVMSHLFRYKSAKLNFCHLLT